jgi:hypothetical protein
MCSLLYDGIKSCHPGCLFIRITNCDETIFKINPAMRKVLLYKEKYYAVLMYIIIHSYVMYFRCR